MTTDTSERGLEDLIVTAMTGSATLAPAAEAEAQITAESSRGTGWLLGDARDNDREYCVDLVHLRTFLEQTQPAVAAALSRQYTPILVSFWRDYNQKFLARA